MIDTEVIALLLAKYATDTERSKAAQLAEKLGTYPQAVTHMVERKRIPVSLRMRAFRLANAVGAKLKTEWLVSPPKPGSKGATNGRTRHAAKAGQRNRKRQKPKSGKAKARKGGKAGAQRAAV